MAIADATLPLQAAIVAALKADADVGSLVGQRIYDRAPEGVQFPYVSIGQDDGEPWEASDMLGWFTEIQIDVWSRKTGRVEARQVQAAVSAALHRIDLTVTGHCLVLGRLIRQTTLGDPDGVTVHGVQVFEFTTNEEDT